MKDVHASTKPVIALDVDGTLADYHGHLLRFAEGWYGRPMPDPQQNTNGLPLYRYMKSSKAKYRECKLAFRQGGMKRNMPCYDGVADMTRDLRKSGAEVWICTTRPYLRLDNVDPDTREWLRRNGVQYDAVLYGENKYRQLIKYVGPRLVAIADDLPEMIEQAANAGSPFTILRDQPYNRNFDGPYDIRVNDIGVMWEALNNRLNEWKGK